MSLDTGTRLGPYEVLAPLGAGGMGEVYRARDTRLGREVAIKVLPESFAKSEVVRARFEREAKSISALNHPHICTLHDVGSENGRFFLVMEMIDGESLASRLEKGPLPLEQVLHIGAEIALGVDAAHHQGIIHRDLKPGNIMLTRSGAKLLDFGLAKAGSETSLPAEGFSSLPTEQRPLTQEGTILGTFQYMSPEQLEGQEADPRTDIFALGAVLYEMVTGKRAFEGKTRTSLIAAIVSSQPAPIATLQPASPPALEHVIRKCLEKDPEDRWQSARDVAGQLRFIGEAGSQAGVAAPITLRRKTRERLAWSAAALAAVLAAAVLAIHLLEPKPENRSTFASILPPLKASFDLDEGNGGSLTISPDGSWVTFLAKGEDESKLLWIRSVDSGETRPISGTEGAIYPFWSHDSRFIAFFANGKLQKVAVAGGPPLALCDVGLNPRRGSWNRDDVIIFSVSSLEAISRVPASGGTPVQVTKLDASKGETTHRWASFLPDGRHFLYMAGTHAAGGGSEINAIYAGDLGSGQSKLLLHARSNVEYADGYLLYVRENVLVAHPFDARRLELTGDPVPVAENVQYNSGFFHAAFAVSGTGTLIYRVGGEHKGMSLEWLDRQGKNAGPIASPTTDADQANFPIPALAPDGGRLAIAVNDRKSGRDDVWIVDLRRNASTRFTLGSGDETAPCWSPDGKRIVYSKLDEGVLNLFSKMADGEGSETLLFRSRTHKTATDWSRDGKFIMLQTFDPSTRQQGDLAILTMAGEPAVKDFLATPFNERLARFSPDGRFVAYVSDEGGGDGIYVMPFPGPGGKYQIVNDAAQNLPPQWGPDGRDIYYMRRDSTVMAVGVTARGGALEIAQPRDLFKSPGLAFFLLDPKGQRFVVGRIPEAARTTPITVLTAWTNKLKR